MFQILIIVILSKNKFKNNLALINLSGFNLEDINKVYFTRIKINIRQSVDL
jgi:hypothetical protein